MVRTLTVFNNIFLIIQKLWPRGGFYILISSSMKRGIVYTHYIYPPLITMDIIVNINWIIWWMNEYKESTDWTHAPQGWNLSNQGWEVTYSQLLPFPANCSYCLFWNCIMVWRRAWCMFKCGERFSLCKHSLNLCWSKISLSCMTHWQQNKTIKFSVILAATNLCYQNCL